MTLSVVLLSLVEAWLTQALLSCSRTEHLSWLKLNCLNDIAWLSTYGKLVSDEVRGIVVQLYRTGTALYTLSHTAAWCGYYMEAVLFDWDCWWSNCTGMIENLLFPVSVGCDWPHSHGKEGLQWNLRVSNEPLLSVTTRSQEPNMSPDNLVSNIRFH